jgi:hypothetical protein
MDASQSNNSSAQKMRGNSDSSDFYRNLLLGKDNDARLHFKLPTQTITPSLSEADRVTRGCDVIDRSQPLFGMGPPSYMPSTMNIAQPDAWFTGLKKDDSLFAQPKLAEPKFAVKQLQPFHEDVTSTQFNTSKTSKEIVSSLLRALKEHECMYSVNRTEGTIKLAKFVDHTRVKATIRIFKNNSGENIVHYAPNFGDRIPATRLYYTIVNTSGLLKLQIPPLLRRTAPRTHCTVQNDADEAVTVFVDMVDSRFIDQALAGAQGIARQCYCPLAAKPYVKYLASLSESFERYESAARSGKTNNIVSRDVATCLATALGHIITAANTTEDYAELCTKAIERLLKSASKPETDMECARAVLKSVSCLCLDCPRLKKCINDKHRQLVQEAVMGCGPCTISNSQDYLNGPAKQLREVLGY